MNLSVTRSDDMSGNIIYKRQPLTVLVTRGHGYLMVNSVSLQVFGLPSGACSVACGEYAAMPVQRLVGGISWHSLVGTSSSLPTAQLHYLRTVMVNGEPAWEMRGPRGVVIYVAARGAPYPLRVMDKARSSPISRTGTARPSRRCHPAPRSSPIASSSSCKPGPSWASALPALPQVTLQPGSPKRAGQTSSLSGFQAVRAAGVEGALEALVERVVTVHVELGCPSWRVQGELGHT